MKVVVVAGTSSGVGKTSLSVGLMRAFRKRGLVVQAFKVGPDFLDPMHHEQATGRPSVNLDGWMLEREQNITSFHRASAGADVAVVEGVMGLFDGRDGKTEVGSTAEMAKWLGAPVILVVDCWAMARSAAAMVKGYQEFDPELLLGGVLFNKVGSEAHSQWLREALEAAGSTAQVLGGIPKDDAVVLKERHLGLHMPGDQDVPDDYMDRLAALLEKHVDLDKVLEVAAQAAVPEPSAALTRTLQPHRTRIAVARDSAFCFYYAENLMLLREAGAELVFFSPLSGSFPTDISGIYLGGGYPEMHAAELSDKRSMRAAIKAFAEAGGVVYAECGGLLYLSQSIQPLNELPAPMVGVFPFRTHMTQNSMKMGYVEVRTQQPCALFPTERTVRGHVYHFSEILQERVVGGFANGAVIRAGSGGEGWDAGYSATLQTPQAEPVDEGFTWRNVLASYVHLHFGSNPSLAAALVDRCCQVDVQGANSAAAEAAARSSNLDAVPPLPRLSAVQSSPNLAALNRKAAFARARSVDMGNGAHIDIEDSYRRAEAARAMSMDLPHMGSSPVYDGVHIKAYVGTGTSGTCSPTISSSASSPTRSQKSTSPYRSSPFGSTGHVVHPGVHSQTHLPEAHDASTQQEHCNGHGPGHETSRDGTRHASTSGRDDPVLRRHSSSVAGYHSHRGSSLESQPHSDTIVSLLPSATEILFSLGLDHRVAGVTDLCDYPKEAHSRPKVSRSSIDTSRMSMEQVEASMQKYKAEGRSPFEIDAAWLARQPPGLLLTQDTCQACDPSTAFVTEALKQAGLLGKHSPTHVMELNPRTMSDVMDSILQVGAVAGVYSEAQRLVDKLRARLRAVAAPVAEHLAKHAHRPRVLSLEGLKPLVLGGQWLPEMKELAGGEFEWQQGGDPPIRITWDQVREYEPEVLILSPCSCNPSRVLGEVCDLAGQPGWWALPAVKSGHVYIMDHAFFSRPGPRLVDGVEMLARVLHPEVVSQRCPEGSVLKLSLRGGQRCRQRLLHNYFLPYQ